MIFHQCQIQMAILNRGPFLYQDHLSMYNDPHRNKTAMRVWYIHKGNSYAGKMISVYWSFSRGLTNFFWNILKPSMCNKTVWLLYIPWKPHTKMITCVVLLWHPSQFCQVSRSCCWPPDDTWPLLNLVNGYRSRACINTGGILSWCKISSHNSLTGYRYNSKVSK